MGAILYLMSECEREWKMEEKKKCIYDAVMLRGLTCGSGFAAVSIAGIIQTYLKENKGLWEGRQNVPANHHLTNTL